MATYTIQNRLGEIQWHTLQPGDTVLVPWRPEPYRERLVIPCRGTEQARITIRGVPGPNGELPVIDAVNATTDPQFALSYPPMEGLGLVMVWRTVASGGVRPGFIDIIGLRIQGAGSDGAGKVYTKADDTVEGWHDHAAGVYLAGCDGVRLIGCDVTDCSNGVFSSDSQECTGVTLDGCKFWLNGKVGTNLCHQTYVQAAGATYRNCTYGPIRPGSYGGALKDRSSGVLIEGNRIEAAARLIDLSEWQNATDGRANWPDAGRTVIRNNVLVNRTGANVVWLEGRGPGTQVEFDHNTVAIVADQSQAYYLRFIRCESPVQLAVSATGNLIDTAPATPGSPVPVVRIFESYGTLSVGPNWIHSPEFGFYNPQPNQVTGSERTASSDTPAAFVDRAGGDYRVTPGGAGSGFGAESSAPPPVVPPPPPVPPPPVPPPPVVPPPVPPPSGWVDAERWVLRVGGVDFPAVELVRQTKR